MIQTHYGVDLANASAKYLFHDRLRSGTERQNAPLHETAGYAVSLKLRQAIVARYYLDKRLDRARDLITQTNMRVVQVAVASGYVSVTNFSKAYKKNSV